MMQGGAIPNRFSLNPSESILPEKLRSRALPGPYTYLLGIHRFRGKVSHEIFPR